MPRGGSRKGEHRGGAKPSLLRIKKADKPKDPNEPVKARKPRGPQANQNGGRRPGSHSKSTFDPQVGVLLNRYRSPMRREQELEMYFMITGKRVRMPKEVMLDAMGYFEDRAVQHVQAAYAYSEELEAAETDEDKKLLSEIVALEEAKAREYLRESVDVAYKVAAYLHPRFSAIMTTPNDGSSPTTLLATLMQELDEAGRPPRYLDHEPRMTEEQDG